MLNEKMITFDDIQKVNEEMTKTTLKNDKTNNDPQVNAIRKVSERLEFVESDKI